MDEGNKFQYSRYVEAIEASLRKIPIKNGTVTVNDIHLETSLPLDLIEELLEQEEIDYPENLDEIIHQ